MIPGEVITPETDIELNVGRETSGRFAFPFL